jgi:hypothetical protein
MAHIPIEIYTFWKSLSNLAFSFQEGSDTPATKEKCLLFTNWSGGRITVKRFSSDESPAGTSMAADFTRDLTLRWQSRTE